MRATCQGDMGAFGELVRRYEGPLYRFLRRMLGNAAEAEDVFQEAMLRVYLSRERFDVSASFRPWLYRIAANCCRDRMRYWRRRPAISLEAAADMEGLSNGLMGRLAARTPAPDGVAEAEELRERIEAAVARLPVKHREVFLMARYEGMPYDEISESLGVPVGTIKSRMNKAVGVLMKELEGFLP
ncbi:MAG: sigma-70 family RNA polymerase sigma factor [Candidatus Hydrogenedentes bacterium]|nr:sigma-70 family RNA polymerase sigma factor [Candidatus Hydrogenedentota bacterium]